MALRPSGTPTRAGRRTLSPRPTSSRSAASPTSPRLLRSRPTSATPGTPTSRRRGSAMRASSSSSRRVRGRQGKRARSGAASGSCSTPSGVIGARRASVRPSFPRDVPSTLCDVLTLRRETGVGPARVTKPPVALDELPPVDAVVISHNHCASLPISFSIMCSVQEHREPPTQRPDSPSPLQTTTSTSRPSRSSTTPSPQARSTSSPRSVTRSGSSPILASPTPR